MASIQKRNGSYRVRVKHDGQVIQSKTFNNRPEALQWGKEAEARLRLGLYFKTNTPKQLTHRILFKQAATHYMSTHSIHKKIVLSETYRLKILISRWGDLPIEQVDKLAVLALRDE